MKSSLLMNSPLVSRPARAMVDILELSERPEVISFAGGLPDPAAFDLEEYSAAMERVLAEPGVPGLNYGPNAGYGRLREWIAARMESQEAIGLTPENILVSSGGLEALNLISNALLEPGAVVVAEAPTYLMALHVFHCCKAKVVGVDTDGDGIIPEALEEKLGQLQGATRQARFLYIIPSFQNPSGATLSAERRPRVVELCRRFGVPIVEDHAYAELRYGGCELPSLKSLAPDQVIFVHTFSKIFAPGLRLGWIAADRDLIKLLGICKLSTDQCAGTLAQRIVYECGRQGWIDEQIERSRQIYDSKLSKLAGELAQGLPGPVTWQRPYGGFYVWLTLPPELDASRLLSAALRRHRLAFVDGPPFYADRSGSRHVRLSFSFLPERLIPEGVSRLRSLLDSALASA